MPRQVKLQDLGTKGDQTTAFRAPNNKYYSSEEAWNKICENEQWRQKSINVLTHILGYKVGMKLPTIAYKKIAEYEIYGYDVLFNTLTNQMSSITWALNNKSFNSETSKVLYIFAIVQNHAGAEWKKKVVAEKQLVSMLKSEDEPEAELKQQKKKTKDISKFLKEDDLWM